MQGDILRDLGPIIHPKSAAILGASGGKGKVGRMFMDRYLEAGFPTLYPVNPKETEILGLKAYPSVKDIPGPVDLAHVLLPPKAVVPAVRDCMEKRVKGVVITSAGFGLEGPDAPARERQIVREARLRGTRIIGPNCLGIYCPASRLPFPLGPSMDPGTIGIVTQSGSFGDLLTKIATENGVYFSKAISCGNESDLHAVDFLEYLGSDPETRIILMYLEGIRDGRRFHALVREIARDKPVLAWKCGTTDVGARAAASHTGALAGSRAVWEGVLDGTGVMRIHSLEDALDCLYCFNSAPLPRGRRVAVATGPGGPAVGTVDTCTDLGLEVPRLSPRTKERLTKIIPPFGSSAENPVDLSIAAIEAPEMYGEVIKILNEDENVDMIIVIGLGGEKFCAVVADAARGMEKPVAVATVSTLETVAGDCRRLLPKGIPVYPDAGRAAGALARLAAYAAFKRH